MTLDEALEWARVAGRWPTDLARTAAHTLADEVKRLRAENAELRRRVTLGGPPAPFSPTWENMALPCGPEPENARLGDSR